MRWFYFGWSSFSTRARHCSHDQCRTLYLSVVLMVLPVTVHKAKLWALMTNASVPFHPLVAHLQFCSEAPMGSWWLIKDWEVYGERLILRMKSKKKKQQQMYIKSLAYYKVLLNYLKEWKTVVFLHKWPLCQETPLQHSKVQSSYCGSVGDVIGWDCVWRMAKGWASIISFKKTHVKTTISTN